MSGGQEAQLAFYYQNLFTVYKILTALRDGQLRTIKIEQKVLDSGREIDVILKYNDGHVEYYEVKSGEVFLGDYAQIKESLLALFQNFRLASDTLPGYWIIINPNLADTITVVISKLRTFRTYRILHPKFKDFCDEIGVTPEDRKSFLDFAHLLSIEPELTADKLRALVLNEIKEISQDIFMNAGHALQPEDLIHRLIDQLRNAIQVSNGEVDLELVLESIVDWCTRNTIASRHAIDQVNFDNAEEEVRTKLQEKFPGIVIALPSPSPAPDFDET